jgi:hypothetical protein
MIWQSGTFEHSYHRACDSKIFRLRPDMLAGVSPAGSPAGKKAAVFILWKGGRNGKLCRSTTPHLGLRPQIHDCHES